MNYSDLVQKKVAGVPVIYLAGAAVIVLAIVAWRMKPSTDFSDSEGQVQGESEGGSDLPTEGDPDYSGLETNGSVTVVQQPTQTTPDKVEKTNEAWVREGAEWAVTAEAQGKGVVTSGTAALAALNKFVYGEDLSYEQKSIVDAVIREKGQPPEAVSGTGNIITDAPAKTQFNPPGIHTVTGKNDNSYWTLSALYYGSQSQNTIDLIQAANVDKLGFAGNYPPGTKVVVPKYIPPSYYTATKTVHTRKDIASRNGISEAAIEALNNTSQADFKVGAKVRVK